jgi:hypothetical protein
MLSDFSGPTNSVYTLAVRNEFTAVIEREGGAHSLWCNPNTGKVEAVPGHTEIADILARKICRGLSVPELGR